MVNTSQANNNNHFHSYVRISVVIPALNEAENLPHVLPKIPSWVHEVILVDGHSKDRTIEVAQELMPDIRIVYQDRRGKGNALQCGFAAATGDIIVMMDADGSTDPQEIPYFVGALLAGADFVKGSRFLQGGGTADMPLYRKLGNWSFVMTVRAIFGGRYSDLCYGYNAFWRRVLPILQLDRDGFEIETVMNVRALQAGLKVTEVPSFEYKRVYGSSNLRTIPDGWRVVQAIFREGARTRVQQARAVTQTAVESRTWSDNSQGELLMVAVDAHGEGIVRVPDQEELILPLIDRRRSNGHALASDAQADHAMRRAEDRLVSSPAFQADEVAEPLHRAANQQPGVLNIEAASPESWTSFPNGLAQM